ncbi:MAG TPA: hypothetical protein VIK84_00270 [Haloplasmataceae bacterium]
MRNNQKSKKINFIVRNKIKRLVTEIILLLFLICLYIILTAYELPIAEELALAFGTAILVAVVSTFVQIMLNITSGDGYYEQIVNNYLNRNCVFCKTSLIGIYPNRYACELDKLFKEAKKEINILATNLESLQQYIDILQECSLRGVKVKITTIHPSIAKEFSLYRVTGRNTDPESRFYSMKNSLRFFIEENKELDSNHKMDIRTFKIMPTLIIFIVDNNCIVSFMVHKFFAREVLHLHFNLEHEKYLDQGDTSISPIIFKRHFDSVFEGSEVVTDELIRNLNYEGGYQGADTSN